MAQWRLALANVAALSAVIGTMTVGTETAATPLISGHSEVADLSALEASAAKEPTEESVQALAQAYLAHRQPGLAIAVLQRAPADIASSPSIRLLEARGQFGLGETNKAQHALRSLAADCQAEPCAPAVRAQTDHYLALVSEVVGAGISDPDLDADATKVAFSKGSRAVQLVAMRD